MLGNDIEYASVEKFPNAVGKKAVIRRVNLYGKNFLWDKEGTIEEKEGFLVLKLARPVKRYVNDKDAVKVVRLTVNNFKILG